MKIIAKTLTIAIVLFISSMTVVGQKSLLFQDVQPLMAVVTDIKYDVELSVEDWMVQPFRMGDTKLSELVKVDVESPLKLEKWMYCCSDWEIVSL